MTTTMEAVMEISTVDDIIRRLLEGKGGKQVQLSEIEIRQLCVNARQIFLSQPNLLDLHAPIRICGTPENSHFDYLEFMFSALFIIYLLCYYKL